MAQKIPYKDDTTYFKVVPRTLQEAFGPHCTDYISEVERVRKVHFFIRPRHLTIMGVVLAALLSFVVIAQAYVAK